RSKRDWSSDVCSSDLGPAGLRVERPHLVLDARVEGLLGEPAAAELADPLGPLLHRLGPRELGPGLLDLLLGPEGLEEQELRLVRSEERRVGKEGRVVW